jgi:hypothetical protein
MAKNPDMEPEEENHTEPLEESLVTSKDLAVAGPPVASFLIPTRELFLTAIAAVEEYKREREKTPRE